MSPAKKRFFFAVLAVIALLTACTSAPPATRDPELVQIEHTVDALLAAENEVQVEGKAPEPMQTPSPVPLQEDVQPASAVQALQATDTPVIDILQQTLVAVFEETLDAQATSLAERAAQATASAQQSATEAARSPTPEPTEEYPLFATPTQEPFSQCKITILRSSSGAETFRLPDRKKLLDLRKGNGIIILQPVNLRNGPTFTNRILLTLRPDPATVPFDPSAPNPTPTLTPRPEIIYKIIGGPAYTTIGDETGADIRFSVSGRKYRWWQIELPNKTTGWLVEASACDQIQFIAKAN